MRDNPGGLLDVAVKIGSRFVADGPIVYTRERDGSEEHLDAQRDRYLGLKMPIVVLVNNYSASAAEVVTGALKDDGVATVVGEQSYGKASVQVLLRLKNGGALIITTAKYLTPAKRDISEKGITPDIVVKASAEDEKNGRGAQLDRAVAFIREKNNVAIAAAPKP
jgi:carboxyl-terminal processing protease